MSIAVCIRCGARKRRPFEPCNACKYDPGSDFEAKAKSLLLSDQYYDEATDTHPSKADLEAAAARIASGAGIEWDERLLARLVREQEILKGAPSPSWLRVLLLCAFFLAIPLSGLILALILHLVRRIL